MSALKQAGVRHIFGVAGPSVYELVDAAGQEPGMAYVYAQGSLAAAHMAEGYGKSARGVGVCISHGDGATNLLDGLIFAQYAGTSVLAFAPTGAVAVRPFVKAALALTGVADIEEAVRLATSSPKGPVWLSVEGDAPAKPVGSQATSTRRPGEGELAERLGAASAPVLVVGDAIWYAHAEAAALALAERLGAAVLTTRSQKGLIRETHPLSIGCQGAYAEPYESDCVVELQPDLIPALELLPARSPSPWIAEYKARWRAKRESLLGSAEAITQWRFYDELARHLTPDDVVVSPDTRWLIQGLESPCKVHLRAFGHGLSAALGVKYAQPERRVVCITGDGSLMSELQELMTLAPSGLALPIFITRNFAFGAIKRQQEQRFQGRTAGADVYSPDLERLAAAFGLRYLRAEMPADLPGVIEAALSSDTSTLADILCPSEG